MNKDRERKNNIRIRTTKQRERQGDLMYKVCTSVGT